MVEHLVSGLDLQLLLDYRWVCSLDRDLQLLLDVQQLGSSDHDHQQLCSWDHLVLLDAQLVACS